MTIERNDDEGSKIIIRNESLEYTDIQVLERVLQIVKNGRVSGNGTSYSFKTMFPNGMHIWAKRNKLSDTFTAH
tara:strand:+ start:1634 stop:1855 length:222 start_codon:yes stop_codon:yes gene_type:complete